jgi:hypothetical protein
VVCVGVRGVCGVGCLRRFLGDVFLYCPFILGMIPDLPFDYLFSPVFLYLIGAYVELVFLGIILVDYFIGSINCTSHGTHVRLQYSEHIAPQYGGTQQTTIQPIFNFTYKRYYGIQLITKATS